MVVFTEVIHPRNSKLITACVTGRFFPLKLDTAINMPAGKTSAAGNRGTATAPVSGSDARSSFVPSARARITPVKPQIVRLKVLLVGDSGVGKSSLVHCIHRTAQGEGWYADTACGVPIPIDQHEVAPTIGANFSVHTSGMQQKWTGKASGAGKTFASNAVLKLNFWDMSGSDTFEEVRSELYRENRGEPQCCVFTFDLTSKPSFLGLDHWFSEATRSGATAGNTTFVLCGTKADAAVGAKRQVGTEARAWALSHDCLYHETSARAGGGVLDMLDTVITAMLPKVSSTSAPAAAGSTSAGPDPSQDSSASSERSRQTYAWDQMGIRDLKRELERLSISHTDCLTKEDLVDRLRQAVNSGVGRGAAGPAHASSADGLFTRSSSTQSAFSHTSSTQGNAGAKTHGSKTSFSSSTSASMVQPLLNRTPSVEDALAAVREEVVSEIQTWSKHKDIRDMLNDVHVRYPSDAVDAVDLRLDRSCGFDAIKASYKKALLKIHPDKHDQSDVQAYVRATEMFKVVHAAFVKLKAQSTGTGAAGKRGSM